ncbi:MAG TPA: KTSC domain-containing protein [Candidatus Udaeobacter sp.]|jgi:hypothetical protein|nr:KTSC domain-containing protein [Candidatus Udaeobacter sp.]
MKAAPTVILATLCLLAQAAAATFPNEQRRAEAIVSHIPREPVNSRAIAAIGYSKRLHALEIEFVNGAIYRYLDVPVALYNAIMAAKSKAQFYDRNVRGKFRSLHVRPRKRR